MICEHVKLKATETNEGKQVKEWKELILLTQLEGAKNKFKRPFRRRIEKYHYKNKFPGSRNSLSTQLDVRSRWQVHCQQIKNIWRRMTTIAL